MPADPALFGVIPPQTARFGNSIFGRIGVASGVAVIPIEAQGYVVTPGPDVTITLTLPRGPGVPALTELTGGIATPTPGTPISAARFRRLPTRANYKFTEGTTFRVGMNFIDVLGQPINLNGASLTVVVYQRNAPRQSATPLLTKTIGSGITMLDTANGKTMLVYSFADTHDLPGIYDWECEVTELNGDVYTPGMGVVIVLPQRRLRQ